MEKKPKIWRETVDKNRITEDFKILYKHDNTNKKWDIDKIANNIKYIITIIQNNAKGHNKGDKLFHSIFENQRLLWI